VKPGDKVWLGVRRLHALMHPGLNFLCLYDGTPAAQSALLLTGAIARMAHARVTLLASGGEWREGERLLQHAKEHLGAGLAALDVREVPDPPAAAVVREVERQTFDLVITGWGPDRRVEAAEAILQAGEHHLLLVRKQTSVPGRVLICAAVGEPGKEDVQFTARLVRHLGATGTLLSVLPREIQDPAELERAGRFLAAGARSMALLGVQAMTTLRRGNVREEIGREMASGGYGMLVVGSPLTPREGKIRLSGVVAGLLTDVVDVPVLVVRSPYAISGPPAPPSTRTTGRV
jgi:sulfate transport system ATP-binding protein